MWKIIHSNRKPNPGKRIPGFGWNVSMYQVKPLSKAPDPDGSVHLTMIIFWDLT